MEIRIDLEPFRKLSYYSTFQTRSSDNLELMESFFGTVPINHIHIESSITNENWPIFTWIFDVNFTVNCSLARCILSGFIEKPRGVLNLFHNPSNLTSELLNEILSGTRANFTKGREYAVTRNFPDSMQADMVFRHYLSPYCFNNRVVTSGKRSEIKSAWLTNAHTGIGGGASMTLLNGGWRKLVCFHLI